MKKILLASQSPRRRELLSKLGFDFDVISLYCDESFPQNLKASEVAGYISKKKADFYSNLRDHEILVTADTVVSAGNEILGKPEDYLEAHAMLRKLSGKTHDVYTGVTFKTVGGTKTITDHAEVTFMEISDEETEYYLQNSKTFDKAGSYGIQDWIGMSRISRICGSYYTIMGLPTHLVYEELKELLD
ncbi:Maf family nucleotide pyrophosphatase [Weeksellaceae bacterium A-14]